MIVAVSIILYYQLRRYVPTYIVILDEMVEIFTIVLLIEKKWVMSDDQENTTVSREWTEEVILLIKQTQKSENKVSE